MMRHPLRLARLSLVILFATLVPAQAQQQMVPEPIMSAIYSNPASVAFGSGDVTVVEFYDFQCSYCKADEEVVGRLLQEGAIKVVYVDFPKLGQNSVTAAEVAVAALRQGADKYWAYRSMLMSKNVRADGDTILQAAQNSGVNMQQLQSDLSDSAVVGAVQRNVELAKSAGVSVTPSFIVNGHFYPGFHTYDEFKQMIDYARHG